jgi:hypothetical protein
MNKTPGSLRDLISRSHYIINYNDSSIYSLLEGLELTGHAEIVTTVDQSAMRGLVPHELMRQGLPHSTDEHSLCVRWRAQGCVEDSPYRTLRMTS